MIYNKEYLEEYKKREQTEIAQQIYNIRWQFVQSFCHSGSLLDYGCATGAFHKMAPQGFVAHGYDINPYSEFASIPNVKYDILTMWDVIEHLPLPTKPLTNYKPEWVFICTPNIDNAVSVREWKHYKPGEHIHYFNLKSLDAVLGCAGYEVIAHNFNEGRVRDKDNKEAILTVVARKC